MTDQPHTPTKAEIMDSYRRGRVWATPNGGRTYAAEFERWYKKVIAAAEQRGAVKTLRDAADHIENEIEFVLPNRYKPLRFRRSYEQDGTGLTPEEWLRARADQMEVDDE